MRSAHLCVVFLLCSACTNIESNNLKTAGMSATYIVSADGTGQTIVSANLNVGGNPTDYVDLSTGDTLTASAGGQSHPMARDSALGAIAYQTTSLAWIQAVRSTRSGSIARAT